MVNNNLAVGAIDPAVHVSVKPLPTCLEVSIENHDSAELVNALLSFDAARDFAAGVARLVPPAPGDPEPVDELARARALLHETESRLDEWRDRAETAERDLWVSETKKRSYQRSSAEWRRYCKTAEAERDALRATRPNVTRDDVNQAVRAATGRYDLGDELSPVVDAVCRLFGVAGPDPIEAKARELWEVAEGDGPVIVWDVVDDPYRERYRRIAAHVLGSER